MTKPTQTTEGYKRAAETMLAATRAWDAANSDAKLDFRPLGVPADHAVAAGLDRAMIRRVGGNSKTRELLKAMDASIGNQGTVAMAEACIERVYSIRRALTVFPDKLPPVLDPHTNKVESGNCTGCGEVMSAATHMEEDVLPSAATAPSARTAARS